MVGRGKSFSCSALVALSFVAIMAYGCPEAEKMISEAVKPPKVKVSDVAVTGLSKDNIDLDLGIVIDNPNPIALSLAGIDYALELGGSELASGTDDKGMNIGASAKSDTVIPISLAFMEVKKIYDKYKDADEIPYRVSGKVNVSTPIGDIPIPYDVKGTLPIVRPPKITSVDLKINSLSFSGADLDMVLNLDNPNNFDLDIQGLDYGLSLNGKQFTSGHADPKNIPAKSSGKIKAPVSIDFQSAGDWAYSLLTKKSADYSLDYNGVYNIAGHKVDHKEEKAGTLSIKR